MLILVAAAFCWANGSFWSGRMTIPSDPIRAAAVQMLVGGGTMMAVALIAGEGSDVDLGAVSAESAAAFAYLVVIGSLVAFTAYAWLLRNAPISQVATYAFVNPVVAIALGALFVHEEITPMMGVASLVIVASVAGTIRSEAQAPPEPAEPDAVATNPGDFPEAQGSPARG
jgi:drug/metabolite transporter (DMT)-like permease